jgi:uncharacterized protein YecT (DUF1311 family)
MRIARLLLLSASLALLPFAVGARAAEIDSARAVLEQCGAYPEAGMRDCLSRKNKDSALAVQRAEAQALASLSRWDEDARYIALARERLGASSKAFVHYRDAHCAFAFSLGGGAIGNALELRRLACRVELNNLRTRQLNDSVSDLAPK